MGDINFFGTDLSPQP